jgi:ABC-type bacteriocin/lantibiotic exporter with double-glycine peptidase domain
MRLKRRVPIHYQDDQVSCGPSCIKMVVDYYLKPKGKRVTEDEWKAIRKSSIRGEGKTRPANMIKTIREKTKLKCKKLTGDLNLKISQIKEAIKMQRPVILYCVYKGKDYHYVIATGIDNKYLSVRDPYPKMASKIELKYFTAKRSTSRKPGQSLRWVRKYWGIEVYEP